MSFSSAAATGAERLREGHGLCNKLNIVYLLRIVAYVCQTNCSTYLEQLIPII